MRGTYRLSFVPFRQRGRRFIKRRQPKLNTTGLRLVNLMNSAHHQQAIKKSHLRSAAESIRRPGL